MGGSGTDGSVEDRSSRSRLAASPLHAVGPARPEQVAQLRALVERHDHAPGSAHAGPADVTRGGLPVLAALEPLLVDGGVRRGSVTVVRGGQGCTSLALAMLAGPTSAGSWAGCVGVEEVGWAAAGELGVALERLVVVRPPEGAVAEVLAALLDAVELVVWGSQRSVSHTVARRLHARARERGAAIVVVDPDGARRAGWPGVPDVELVVRDLGWSGIGAGWGHLRSRHVLVEAGGRRSPGPPRRAELLLPGPGGAVASPGRRVGDAAVDPVAPTADERSA